MGLDNLIGNNKVKNVISNIIENDNILHSYIFTGTEGIGKFLFAKEFANMIFNKSNDINGSEEISLENNPDLVIIDSEDSKSIKIEQIRQMEQKILEKPITHTKKVYIINNGDLMTKEAQNCLLKTLEEPPEYVVIILVVTNESKILTTIKSRCVKITFNKISNENIIKYIKDNYEGTELNENMLKLCDGSIGKAVQIQDKVEVYKQVEEIFSNLKKEDISYIWNNSEVLYKSKEEIIDLLDYINIIIYNKIYQDKEYEYINCIDIVEEAKNKLNSNTNYDMTIDILLLKLWEEINEKHRRS